MQAAQDGDRAAYAELLGALVPLLRRVLGRQRPYLSADDVEDLVQDILLAVHGARATYDAARPFLPWLMAIAHNRAVDAVRRHSRRSAREVAVDEYPETFEVAETNYAEDAYGDPVALRQAIDGLPEGQRRAIELLKLHEMSLKEASAVSGMSIGSLKVATHRATRSLRFAIKATGGDGH
jgi:RNA polymerase sigma-70 factor (ECF subfamily)